MVWTECPYNHPRVCTKLMYHGNGKFVRNGWNGTNCRKAHLAMCYNYMITKECFKTCTRGGHGKGTKFGKKEAMQHDRKEVSNAQELGSSQEFPKLQQLHRKNIHQKRPEQAHKGETSFPDIRVPPPTYKPNQGATSQNWGDMNRCVECPAIFQNKNDIKQQMRNVHDVWNNAKFQNEPSFLDLMQKSLEKMSPKILQNMANVTQEPGQVRNGLNPSKQTGPNVQQVGWELVRQNLR